MFEQSKFDLTDTRMHDGSRQFVSLPESVPFDVLRDHIARLPGAVVTGFLSDGIVEVWIDFEFENHRFTINNQFAEYWFFVADPSCPAEILERVAQHCSRLLGV